LSDDPASLAAADVVVTMLTDAHAARSVLVESGLLEKRRPGSVVLEACSMRHFATDSATRTCRR